jgi:hypothetical protein
MPAFFFCSPLFGRDVRIASQALRVLLNEIDKVAAIAGDVAHQLRNLRVTVES